MRPGGLEESRYVEMHTKNAYELVGADVKGKCTSITVNATKTPNLVANNAEFYLELKVHLGVLLSPFLRRKICRNAEHFLLQFLAKLIDESSRHGIN